MGKRGRGTEGKGRMACCRFHCALDFPFYFFALFGLGFRLATKARRELRSRFLSGDGLVWSRSRMDRPDTTELALLGGSVPVTPAYGNITSVPATHSSLSLPALLTALSIFLLFFTFCSTGLDNSLYAQYRILNLFMDSYLQKHSPDSERTSHAIYF